MRLLGLALFLLGATAKHHDAILTPNDMLALPRPAPIVVSPDGQLGIQAVSRHSFETRQTTTSLHLIQLNGSKHEPDLLLESIPGAFSFSDPIWLSDSTYAYLNRTGSESSIWSRRLQDEEPKHVLTFPAGTSPSGLKFVPSHHSSEGVLAFSAHVWNGFPIEETARKESEYENRGDGAMVWDETFIREWDTWRNPEKVHQLFLTPISIPNHKSKLNLDAKQPAFHAPFNTSHLWSLMQPFGKGDYDLAFTDAGKLNVAIQIKDPNLNYAFHTRRQVYVTSLTFTQSETGLVFSKADGVKQVTPGEQGDVSGLSFSPNGTVLAYLQRSEDGAESDRNTVHSYDLVSQTHTAWTETWDRSVGSLAWAKDGRSVFLLAEEEGSTLPYHLTHPGHLPTPLLFNGTTSAITPLKGGKLLLGISTLTHPTENYILDLDAGNLTDGDKYPSGPLVQVTHWSTHGLAHVSLSAGEKFWFKGAHNRNVMGWLIPPRGFKKGSSKTYPMAFLIHGGPEGAWEDSWSTRWNPNVFAQQGYFVVAINPTGSTGYGQDFVTAIHENWGESPFKDLVAGLQYVLDQHPEIDPERLAALGASYGGYMINWLQGHNDHTNFKAFVCHDGLFETHNMYYSTEEVYFPQKENGGLPPWQNRAPYERWSPNNFVHEWSTPALIIHGGKDYRVPDVQGISAFTALQSRGIPSRFLYFKDENHWVLDPQNSLRWHHEVFRWLEEWVGEAKEGKSAKEFRIQN